MCCSAWISAARQNSRADIGIVATQPKQSAVATNTRIHHKSWCFRIWNEAGDGSVKTDIDFTFRKSDDRHNSGHRRPIGLPLLNTPANIDVVFFLLGAGVVDRRDNPNQNHPANDAGSPARFGTRSQSGRQQRVHHFHSSPLHSQRYLLWPQPRDQLVWLILPLCGRHVENFSGKLVASNCRQLHAT